MTEAEWRSCVVPTVLLDRASLLVDAGCEDARIVEHFRGEGPHVRGCWVVDLILEMT
jgi:hypothetical protein